MKESCVRDGCYSMVPAAALADGIRRTPLDHFVIWTGDIPHVQPGSRIGRALACVDQPGVPLSLRALVQRAARVEGDFGVPPDAVRNAVRQHQAAQPAVLFLVERRPSGDFVAVTDIPFAGAGLRRFRSGDVVLSAQEALRVAGQRAAHVTPAARPSAAGLHAAYR